MNAHDVVLDQILEQLRQGVVPWRSGFNGNPINYVTRHPYRGINRILLSCAQFGLPYYLSFRQVQELGGSIKQGEKGRIVCFFKKVEDEDKEYDIVLRYYRVWNITQTTLVPKSINAAKPQCEDIYARMPHPPKLIHDCHTPCYIVRDDTVVIPALQIYENTDTYYSTLFHELIHSTGHPKRLLRFGEDEPPQEDKISYGLEELIAEIGSSFLCAETGILPNIIDNNAAYIGNWLRVLENNRSYIFKAAAQAQKAVDFIQGVDGPAVSRRQGDVVDTLIAA